MSHPTTKLPPTHHRIATAITSMNRADFTVGDIGELLPDVPLNTISHFCRRQMNLKNLKGRKRKRGYINRFIYRNVRTLTKRSGAGTVADALFEALKANRGTPLRRPQLLEGVRKVVPTAKDGSLKSILHVWKRDKHVIYTVSGYLLAKGIKVRPPVVCHPKKTKGLAS